jgi:hypothetical protein
MLMMFVGGVVLMFEGFFELFLPYDIYGVGVFVPTQTLKGVNLLKFSQTLAIEMYRICYLKVVFCQCFVYFIRIR